MRTFWKWTLILALPALWAATARPEERPIPEGATVHLLLLRQKSVQQDLNLTPEVAQKIIKFTHKQHEAVRKVRKMSEAEQEQKFKELEIENQKFLMDTLTEKQRKRLDQITMQVASLQLLTRPEAIKALNLTEEQQQKFKEMRKEVHKEVQELIQGKNREGRNEKLAKLREGIRKKIGGLLTDEQKEKAKKRMGEPFKGEIVFEEPEPESKDKSEK
jgi:Spy/CpxP family protein refolding chaperone